MKPSNFLKKLFAALFWLAVSSSAQSQQETSNATVQKTDTVMRFNIANYHCYSSSFLDVTILKECDGYIAYWRTHYDKMALQKPGNGTVWLTGEQLAALSELAQQVSTVTEHQENCSGTIHFNFISDRHKKKERLCDCAPTAWSKLYTIIESGKQGSVQHQL